MQGKPIQFVLVFFLAVFIYSCKNSPANDQRISSYVNPFIGTGGHGHTYPGATLPFGMVQLSPDTRLSGWDGCSGYHYSDSVIYGFSHTHLSGTGVSDYGDILLIPTDRIVFDNGSAGNEGYSSKFDHQKEKAHPGYYAVQLEDTGIEVELTSTLRCGFHRYTFLQGQEQVVILDLLHRDKLIDSHIEQVSETEFRGKRYSSAWANDQRLYFYLSFSRSVQAIEYIKDKEARHIKAAFLLDKNEEEVLEIAVGISSVDYEGAKKNLDEEIGKRSFAEIKEAAQKIWNKQLSKVTVQSNDKKKKSIFYTSLYHTMLAPNIYQDVDGKYRGMDLKIHQSTDFNYYTVFSLWDTYRATHPLFTIIERERTTDFIRTFIKKYKEGGILPIWDLSACYTGCMIGYHSVSVIADAFLKGIRGFDEKAAFAAMKHSAMQDHLGLKSYKQFGFIPMEAESESVSKTLEYAYDDWTIAQMAKMLDEDADFEYFISRAQNYKNVYDPDSKFMRARFRNKWFSPFDPYEVNFNYTEANAWQYSFYVPHDITGLIRIMGGKNELEKQLDALFNADVKTSGRNQADITGLIGQYAHGNEPSHHIAYLYNFVNKPHKTQETVFKILTELYSDDPDGISGNEDCGQMSAWYVFSALGFYPVTPGSDKYIIGTPLMKEATIHLENGNQFRIVAHNLSDENFYIKNVRLNKVDYPTSYLSHRDILKGGILEFEMSHKPADWGTTDASVPVTEIKEQHSVTPPYIEKGEFRYKDSTRVILNNIDKESKAYFSINGSDFSEYLSPILITDPSLLKVYAEKKGTKSAVIATEFKRLDPRISIELYAQYANQYNGGGDNALIDGVMGTKDFKTGTWQGFFNQDLNVMVDLGYEKSISAISIGFLRNQESWIFLPKKIQFSVSLDGSKFITVGIENRDSDKKNDAIDVIRIKKSFQTKKVRFIKISASTIGDLPSWHHGYGPEGFAWIFSDEIEVF